MRRIGSAIFICALWTVSAHGAEHCGKPSTAGIKRCEQVVASKVDPTTNWQTITYIDSNKEIVDLSITFSRKLGEPIYADALVGGSIMISRQSYHKMAGAISLFACCRTRTKDSQSSFRRADTVDLI